MLPLAILSLLTLAAAATRFVPTAEEMQARFEHGQNFYASGAYDQAIENYRHIMRSRHKLLAMEAIRVSVGQIDAPLQEVAAYQIGNAYFKMGEEELKRAAQARSDEARAQHQGRADDLLTQAVEAFVATETLSATPALQALSRSRAVACAYRMGDYRRTIDEARQLVSSYPTSSYVAHALYDIGWSHYQLREYAQSIAVFQDLGGRFPSGYRTSRALFQIGECYFELGRFAEAIPSYQRLVDSQRLDRMSEREILRMQRNKLAGLVDETELEIAAKALLRIGECRERTGEYALAVEAYALVAARFADERRLSEEAYLRQAQLHYQRGDVAASIAVYQRALEAQQDDFGRARLQLLLANRYFETGNYLEAVSEYSAYRDDYAAFAAQAGLPLEGVGLQIARAWFGRAEAEEVAPEERADLFRRAEAELRRTLEAFPNSTYEMDLRFNLGLALQRQNEATTTAQALDVFQALAASPQAGGYRHSALFQGARILHGRGEYAGAIQIYQRLDEELGDKPEADIARFEAAIAQRDAGAWEEAVTSFLQVRGEAEIHSRSRLEAGRLLLQQGRSQRAIAVLREGAQTETARASQTLSNYLIATALSRAGDLNAALPYFDQTLAAADSAFAHQAFYGRGMAYFRLGQQAQAIADLERAAADSSLTAASRLLAAAYIAGGRVEQGLQLYQRLLQTASSPRQRGEYLLALAEIAYRQERYGQAIATCQELLALDFAEGERPLERTYYLREKGHWLMADVALRLEDYQAVADAAALGLTAYPSGFYAPDFLFLGGLAALQLDRYEEAVGRLQDSITRYPEHPNAAEAHYYLGYAYFNQTLFAQALAAFELVVAWAPDRNIAPDALFRLAECRYNLQQYDQAQDQYQQLIDRYTHSPLAEEALYNIGWCLMNSLPGDADQKNKEVQRAFAAYLKNFPQGRYAAMARYTLGELLYNQGDHQAAYDIFRQVEEQYPGTPAATRAAAMLPELREAVAYGDYAALTDSLKAASELSDAEAIRALIPRFEQVWRQFPHTSSGVAARANIGVCHQKLGEWQRAVAVFDAILSAAREDSSLLAPNIRAFVERRRATIARKHL